MPPRGHAPVPDPNDPAQMTDDELAQATAQASRDSGTTVQLRLHRAFPVDHFEHKVDGKTYSIPATDEGTDVPAEVVDALIDAAKDAGLTVKKVSE